MASRTLRFGDGSSLVGVILANFGIFRPSSALDYNACAATRPDWLVELSRMGVPVPMLFNLIWLN